MNVRLQMAMIFHLDKCIGCHTCSIACKNVWTDRRGAEYMWWNNVETKPGTGYPTKWEDQGRYRGGWKQDEDGMIRLRGSSKAGTFADIFHQPNLPTIDDYYEPYTYRYSDLFDAPEGADQPTARPISMITGKPIDIQSSANWDDDLGGSPVYAENDPNLDAVPDEERKLLFQLERMIFFYIPRICNHCLNPSCLAACPSGAIYKRGEDGIVLINQEICRGWRFCVTGCPYKKTYYNWATGKSEKCILCYPRVETGQAQACFHSCVGRIRYTGGLLYDADRLPAAASVPDARLVDSQREMILDPFDEAVIDGARANGMNADTISACQRSPVYQYVKLWKLALPLHPEFRTMPMLFYVPPVLPVTAAVENGVCDTSAAGLFGLVDQQRAPMTYMAALFGGGNEEPVRYSIRKQVAVRFYRRMKTVGDLDAGEVDAMMAELGADAEELEAIYRLTSLPSEKERYVFPPSHREEAEQMQKGNVQRSRGDTGFGFLEPPVRGF